ncbi:hypothetical protein [Streptomyces sp. NBC_00286]|uniref:hypothetical protein n=1 Tax=Streptomyces sp. NBC_00286 TaxID=2975701 RepID=UPI002E2A0475|nr:hypothetical protein [Streptomyces sp. NBC_00286]
MVAVIGCVEGVDAVNEEAVVDEEVFPQRRGEYPHVHGQRLSAGERQGLRAGGDALGGAAGGCVGMQDGEEQTAVRLQDEGDGREEPVRVDVAEAVDGLKCSPG